MRRLGRIWMVVVVVGVVCGSAQGKWVTLDFPGATSTMAHGISGGKVVGEYTDASGTHGFIYEDETWTPLDFPGADYGTIALGTDGESVVGYFMGGPSAFVYDGETWTRLDTPVGAQSRGRDVDGERIVITDGLEALGATSPYLYDGTTWISIHFPGALSCVADGIDGDNIVGSYRDALYESWHGFLYDGSTWTTLDFPGAGETHACGIDRDRIVGSYYGHGFLYDGTTWTTLDFPGASNTYAEGIDGDKVVGFYDDGGENRHGFIYTIRYGGGSGTPEDPYQIHDANHMQAIGADANDWDKCFVLMDDIDLSVYTGEEFNIIGYASTNPWDGQPFLGVFNGNDYTISNFTYVSDDRSFVGLFGVVGGEIKNLGLIDAEVDPGRGIVRRRGEVAGSLTGILIDEGIITNCYAEGGSVTGDYTIGGLVGCNYYGIITSCYATGSVRCSAENDDYDGDAVGGLVGWNSGTITNCYATGSVTGSDDDYHEGYYVGGLVGWNGDAMTNCYATGSVTGDVDVGGLVGYNNQQSTITNCYATGSITGDHVVGGLVGANDRGTITNCYATGSVTGDDVVGGLMGKNSCRYGCAPIILSYWDIETSGEPNMCGNPEDPNCDNSYGLPTSEMKQQSTFADWDFINVWDIGENQTYPYLRTVPAGDINKDRIVNFLDLCIVAEEWMREN